MFSSSLINVFFAGMWEFLFSTDFLCLKIFLCQISFFFLLFSAYFWHFYLISWYFSSFVVCCLSHLSLCLVPIKENTCQCVRQFQEWWACATELCVLVADFHCYKKWIIEYAFNNIHCVGLSWLPLDAGRDDPWRLLKRTQASNRFERLAAVSSLANKHHWNGKD